MAAGTPDYFRTVRETHGTPKTVSGSTGVVASATTELVSVDGKGTIYGGSVYIDAAATQKNDYPSLVLDDNVMHPESFSDLNLFGIHKERSLTFYLTKYDDTNFIYSVVLSNLFTFEKSFVLRYLETHGNTPAVKWSILYGLV